MHELQDATSARAPLSFASWRPKLADFHTAVAHHGCWGGGMRLLRIGVWSSYLFFLKANTPQPDFFQMVHQHTRMPTDSPVQSFG